MPVVIVDLHTHISNTAALHLLVRLRRVADLHGVTLCVTIRSPQAARVLHLARLHDFLRVIASLPALGPWPPPAPAPRTGSLRCAGAGQ